MADTQQQYGGAKAELPELLERQFGYCLDTEELYIGGTDGNVLVGSGKFSQDISDLKANKLTANQSEAVAEIDSAAELSVVIATVNALISNLKTAGLMK